MRRFLYKGSAVLLIPHIKFPRWLVLNELVAWWMPVLWAQPMMDHVSFVAELDKEVLQWIRVWLTVSFTIWSLSKTCQTKLKNFANVHVQCYTISSDRLPLKFTLQQKTQKLDRWSKWTCTVIKEQYGGGGCKPCNHTNCIQWVFTTEEKPFSRA